MTVTLHETVELDQSARARGGLLDVALPLPAGWERGGITVPFYGCGEPILRNKCITATDEPHQGGVAEFSIFPIEQSSIDSTLCRGLDHEAHARNRYTSTTEWAVGRQLAEDVVGTGSPSFADATVLGTVASADFVAAVGCLEQAAADAGFGSAWVLHAPVRAASYLAKDKQLRKGLSPTGNKWAISAGYPVQGPTTIRLWATGTVWAGVDTPSVHGSVDWQRNSDEGWALGSGLVGFDPCINIAIDITVPACPVAP